MDYRMMDPGDRQLVWNDVVEICLRSLCLWKAGNWGL